MRNGLAMQTGPAYLKPAILGGIVIAFGALAYAVTAKDTDTPQPDAAVEPMSSVSSTEAAAPAAPAAPTLDQAASAPMSRDSQAAPTAVASAEPAPSTLTASAATPLTSPAAANPEPTVAMPAEATSTEPSSQKTEVTEATPARKPKLLKPMAPPAIDALRTWWQPPADPNRFGVEYVGQAADQNALVVRFNQPVPDPVADQNIRLISHDGEPVAANWQPGLDPRVLVAPNLDPGRYTVLMGPQLASVQGQSLGVQLHGPAFIQ